MKKSITYLMIHMVILTTTIVGCNRQKSLVEEGDTLREQGRHDEAIAKYDEALRIDEKSEFASMARTGKLMAMYNKAERIEKEGELKRAFDLYDQWLAANPDEDKNKARAKIVNNAEQVAIKILSAKEINDASVKQLIYLAEIVLKYDQSAFKKAVWKAFIAFDRKDGEGFINNYKEASEKKPNLLYEPYKFLMEFFDQKVMEMIAGQGAQETEQPAAAPKKGGKKK